MGLGDTTKPSAGKNPCTLLGFVDIGDPGKEAVQLSRRRYE
jgi:hypothetical protein